MPIDREQIIQCPYGTARCECHMKCEKFREVVGFGCSIALAGCQAHIDAGGFDVPLEDVPALAARITGHLTSRVIGGDCPEFQGSMPIVLEDIAAKLKDRLSPEQRAKVWLKAVDYWQGMPEKPEGEGGGHPSHVVKEKALLLAELWDLDLEQEIESV